jgi:hypothetical protein
LHVLDICDDNDVPLMIHGSLRRLSLQPQQTPRKPTQKLPLVAATVLIFHLISKAFRPGEHQIEHRTGTAPCLAWDSIEQYLEADHVVTEKRGALIETSNAAPSE